jgi:AcrR family transcriptional regulator/DNA-binding MarR family transcriptional regulator
MAPSPAAKRRPSRAVKRQGTNGGHVQELQRNRLIAGLIAEVEESGESQPTVRQIIARARVSRKTFYELFRDREECFLAAFEDTFARAAAAAGAAYQREAEWRAGVRAALGCLLELIDAQPGLARLCVVHSLGAGQRVQLRRAELMAELAETIDLGRGAAAGARDVPRMTADAIVGGIHSVIHDRLLHGERQSLVDLIGPLTSMIVLPYLGADVAQEERARPATSRMGAVARAQGDGVDPLAGLNIRLTYRTVRVLEALAEQPLLSNSCVAAEAGILDQGQVSKLLARLSRLGLAENVGDGPRKGSANAWRLTARGARLERATRPRLS